MDTINPKSCVHWAECRVRLFCANVPEAGVRFQLGERVPRCERAPESARRPIFHEIEQVGKGVDGGAVDKFSASLLVDRGN